MTQTYSGFTAIVGAPTAVKSTLTNALVGAEVSIVTHKVQTTRFQIRGIAMLENSQGEGAQAVMIDMPGIFQAKESDRLSKSMVHAAWTGMNDADIIVHVIDAPAWLRQEKGEGSSQDRLAKDDSEGVIKGLKKRQIDNAILALNKIDEIAHDEALPLIQHFAEAGVYRDIIPISALNLDGVERLGTMIADSMPAGPYLYSPDQSADIPMRLMAAEITREKIFLRLHDELPYASPV